MLAQIDFQQLEQATLPNFAGGDLGDIVSAIIPYVFAASGLIILVYFVIGGLEFLTSGGDPKKTESAKGKLTGAIVGFVIIFISFWLVQVIGRVLDIEIFETIFG